MKDAFYSFYALHQAVVHVGNLVFPSAEAAATVNVAFFEYGHDLVEYCVAFDRGHGISVRSVHDVRMQSGGINVDHTALREVMNAIPDQFIVADRRHVVERDLTKQGAPLGVVRYERRGELRERCAAVETLFTWEIQPCLSAEMSRQRLPRPESYDFGISVSQLTCPCCQSRETTETRELR